MMRDRFWLTARALAGGLLLALALGVAAQDGAKETKAKKDPPDPPRTGAYMGQLRALFAKWDTDKDSYLDKAELAIGFRGARAKPFDDKEAKAEEKSEDKEKSAKDKEDKEDKPSPGKKPDYSRFADYNFLVQLDKDADEKISRSEFMAWARDYATQLRDRDELVKKLQQSQNQLKKSGAKAKNRKSLEAQVKRQQQQIQALQKKMARYAAIQRGLGR